MTVSFSQWTPLGQGSQAQTPSSSSSGSDADTHGQISTAFHQVSPLSQQKGSVPPTTDTKHFSTPTSSATKSTAGSTNEDMVAHTNQFITALEEMISARKANLEKSLVQDASKLDTVAHYSAMEMIDLRQPWRVETQNWMPETALIERAKKKDPGVFQVSMFETRSVDIPPGEAKQVFTSGLGGCTAVAIVSQHPDGKRSLTLSHHPPTHTDQQVREIARDMNRHAAGDPTVKRTAFIVTPGDPEKQGEKWVLEPNQQYVVARVKGVLQHWLPGVEPKTLSYSELKMRGESRAFILDVPSAADKPIQYQGIVYGKCEF